MLSKLIVVCSFAAMMASPAFAASCNTLDCQTTGATCGTTTNNVAAYCQGDASCVPTTAGATTKTCVLASAINGRTCKSSSDCSGTSSLGIFTQLTYPYCTATGGGDGVCRAALGYANDICATAADCDSNNCVNGKCVAKTALGAACTSDSECPALAACVGTSTRVCTALVGAGGNCAADDDLCPADYTCFNSACVKRYSVAKGGSCADGTSGKSSSVCGYELTCDDDSKTCVSNTATTFTSCNTTSQCGNGACSCNTKVGTQQCFESVNKCTDENLGYRSCLVNSGCHIKSSVSNVNSCAYRSCGDAYLTLAGCQLRGVDQYYSSSCIAGIRSPASIVESTLLILF